MRQVYSTPDSARVGLVRGMLENANIRCEVRNDVVSQVMMGVQYAPELWVRDEDYEEAFRLVTESEAGV
jgi:hypothetical protein